MLVFRAGAVFDAVKLFGDVIYVYSIVPIDVNKRINGSGTKRVKNAF